jgi:hypothetical protein
MKWKAMLASSAMLVAVSTSAQAIVFDLEDQVVGQFPNILQTVSGVSMAVSRVGGVDLEIRNIGGFSGVPASFGSRTLAPFNDTNGGPFLANFFTAVNNLKFSFGDFRTSDVDIATATAYSGLNGTGSVLGTFTSAPCCGVGSGFELQTGSITASGIQSIVFGGGSPAFPQSLFFDNIEVNISAGVPEPSTWAMMLLGFFGLAWTTRRRRQALPQAA